MNDLEQLLLSKIEDLQPVQHYKFMYPITGKKNGPHFDFAFPDIKLAVEVDGGTMMRMTINGKTYYKPGGHSGAGYERDCRKGNLAVEHGWKLLRFTGAMIKSGEAERIIRHVYAGIRSGPTGPAGDLDGDQAA